MPADRQRNARNMQGRAAGGVRTNQVHRSLMNLTLNLQRKQQVRRTASDEYRMTETDEMFKVDINGKVGAEPLWKTVELDFRHHFFYAPLSRDAVFQRPHFTYGSRLLGGGPVVIVANVTGWSIGTVDQVRGASVQIGAFAPAATELLKFRGEVHLTFAGFAAPVFEDVEE